MLSEDGLEAERLGGHESDVLQDAGALVTVHDVNLLPDEDLSDKRHRVKEGQKSDVASHNGKMRNVIDLHAVSHMTHAGSLVLELVREEGDAVAALHQALSQLVAVSLYTAELGESKVGDDKHVMLLL